MIATLTKEGVPLPLWYHQEGHDLDFVMETEGVDNDHIT